MAGQSRFDKNTVYGLRTVGEYKVYRKGQDFFVSHKNHERLRRLQLADGKSAIAIAVMAVSDLVSVVERRLVEGKLAGSPLYYEVKHGRL